MLRRSDGRMDSRAAATLTAQGYDASRHRAAQFSSSQAEDHDLVLAMDAANFAELFAWYAQGRLRPHVSQTFALEDFAQALDVVMNRRAKGKVVLQVP